MSLDLDARLREFFSSAPQTRRVIETLEIIHSDMSQAFYLWREPVAGEITTEDGVRDVLPWPFEARIAGSEGHLDQVYEIPMDTTEQEDTFRRELDSIPIDSSERVRLVYREYLSDDLTDMLTRAVLQVESIVYAAGVARITAASPRLNITRTGEVYTPREVPMLRAFL